MKTLFITMAGFVVFLTGCQTVGQVQSNCEATTTSFPAMAICLKTSIAQDGRLSGSQVVKFYLLKADQLSEQVAKGNISDVDARVELQQLYVQLKGKENADQAAALSSLAAQQAAATAAQNANRPKTTNCHAIGDSIHCTTY
jgi:hypothetical protein